MSFKIVRYTVKHQEALVDLWEKCGLIVPQNDPIEDIQKKIDYQPELFFIALLDDQLIGSVMVGYEGHRGWLNYLAVHPSFQKRGFGKKLVEKAIAELRKIGCLKLNLQVRRSNKRVIEFYKQIGFKEEERVSLGLRLRNELSK
ncbi:MAG: GNAT family acetyltransferase [Candidatus Bathyarchaeota archaeon]|nr:MAG: GNAT family acetyltransferase [Candidatus Bathyarchaeota archaeon]